MGWLDTALNVVGTVAGLGGSLAASSKSSKGANRAADLQYQQYQQSRQDLAPWREVGGSALNAYARAMGLPAYGEGGGRSSDPTTAYQYPTSGKVNDFTVSMAFQEFRGRKPTKRELDYYTGRQRGDQLYYDVVQPGIAQMQESAKAEAPAPAPADGDRYGGFETSPGYQFRLDEGEKSVNRNMAARGLLNSGSRAKALTRYSQGVASDEFGNYMNRLAGAANIGQTATNTGINAGMNYAANAGNAMQNSANARASGYLGVANTLNNGINNYLAYRPFMTNNPGMTGYSSAQSEWGSGGGYSLKNGLG